MRMSCVRYAYIMRTFKKHATACGVCCHDHAWAAEYWGSLAGVDGAALVEVVEHLDPTPLRNLGPCLLGGLQPKLLVVTTPNREYNAVLHQLGNALLPNKLRNTDHRFEW